MVCEVKTGEGGVQWVKLDTEGGATVTFYGPRLPQLETPREGTAA